MERTYFLKFVGNEPTRTTTQEGKRYVEPQEIFEVNIRDFKNLTGLYPRLFKEVELDVKPTNSISTKVSRVKDVAPEETGEDDEQPTDDQETGTSEVSEGDNQDQSDNQENTGSEGEAKTTEAPTDQDQTEGQQDDSKPSIEELRKQYEEKFKEEVSKRYKNDYDYIYNKVNG